MDQEFMPTSMINIVRLFRDCPYTVRLTTVDHLLVCPAALAAVTSLALSRHLDQIFPVVDRLDQLRRPDLIKNAEVKVHRR